MRICAVSPWKLALKEEILKFLAEAKADLVVLPGACRNTPSPKEVQQVIGRGIRVFVESGKKKGKATPYLVTSSEAIRMPLQVFPPPKSPTVRCMDKLVSAWLDRTFSFGTRTVTFTICGEINGFSPDGSVKHGRELPFDILANPVHTVMGRWQHLGRKLSELSKGKVVIHVANNDRNHKLNTDVRIYVDGTLQKNKNREGKLTWCECRI